MSCKLGLLVQAPLAGKRRGREKKANHSAAKLAELSTTGMGNACNPDPCSTAF